MLISVKMNFHTNLPRFFFATRMHFISVPSIFPPSFQSRLRHKTWCDWRAPHLHRGIIGFVGTMNMVSAKSSGFVEANLAQVEMAATIGIVGSFSLCPKSKGLSSPCENSQKRSNQGPIFGDPATSGTPHQWLCISHLQKHILLCIPSEICWCEMF